jgi:hypothetical protein
MAFKVEGWRDFMKKLAILVPFLLIITASLLIYEKPL